VLPCLNSSKGKHIFLGVIVHKKTVSNLQILNSYKSPFYSATTRAFKHLACEKQDPGHHNNSLLHHIFKSTGGDQSAELDEALSRTDLDKNFTGINTVCVVIPKTIR